MNGKFRHQNHRNDTYTAMLFINSRNLNIEYYKRKEPPALLLHLAARNEAILSRKTAAISDVNDPNCPSGYITGPILHRLPYNSSSSVPVQSDNQEASTKMKVFCSLAIAFYLFGAAMAVCGTFHTPYCHLHISFANFHHCHS